MSNYLPNLGQIQISNNALAEIAGYTVLECYGVVGMANPNLKSGVASLLSRDKLKKGIKVTPVDEGIEVDLYVVVEHGINIAEVAHNLITKIKYELERLAQVNVVSVDVHVQGIRTKE